MSLNDCTESKINELRTGRVNFSVLGNNTAGLKAKKDSLQAIINMLNRPSCITLQETKLGKNANFNLENYPCFYTQKLVAIRSQSLLLLFPSYQTG